MDIHKLENIDRFDLPNMYHHLKESSSVQLLKKSSRSIVNGVFEVFFRSYKIGEIILSPKDQTLLAGREELSGVIIAIDKEKFMPIKSIKIQSDLYQTLPASA